jgi:hypothetical protein
MLFRIESNAGRISPVPANWRPAELELESYLLPASETDEPLLEPSVFGEPLLFIRHQVRTRRGKRADILALDRSGRLVIVELKKDRGQLGVETQALQYLAEFSAYRGRRFIERFEKEVDGFEEAVLGFVGDDVRVEDLNRTSRIVLLARRFDPALFSMCEWLASSGVSTRCIVYTPAEIGGELLLSFAVAFDRSQEPLYPLEFTSPSRTPRFYWHNIGDSSNEWWRFLVDRGVISASFSNQPGDQGERLLRGYVPGDTIIAYAKGHGAVGWGVVPDSPTYELLPAGHRDVPESGYHRHRLSIQWKAAAKSVEDGLPPGEIRERFGIYHPVATSASIAPEKARALIAELANRLLAGDAE